MRPRTTLRRNAARGFGLVEILVGVTIGLIALLIVYQVLALSEGYRRTTTAGGDAQSSGMISSFVLASDIANGGHTISESAAELASCQNTGNFATTWRPIPVLITDGGADAVSDSFAIFGGANRRLVSSLDTLADVPPGGNITVQSPLGYHRSWTAGAGESAHLFVISDIASAAAVRCEVATVSPWPPPLDPLTGITTITPIPGVTVAYPQGSSWLINLGPADRVRKVFYDVAGDVVRRTDLMTGAPPNPIVSNIVLMKAQYGLDTDNNNFVDTWMPARNFPWDQPSVLGGLPNPGNNATVALAKWRQIKAIRLAVVVRSAQFERPTDAEGRATVTDLTADFTTTLFPCNGLVPCTGEMLNVTIPGTANYRYRVYEQVIPLTNQIWNAT